MSMRTFVRSALLAAGFTLSALSAVAQEPARNIVTVQDADYFGFDLRTVEKVTLDQCKQTCIDDASCKAFTFNTKAKWCFLKSDFNKMIPATGAVAGKIVMASGEQDLGAPMPLEFVPDYLVRSAQRLRDELAPAQGHETLGREAILAIARHNARSGTIDQALAAYKSALDIDPEDTRTWIEMAEAANRVTGNWRVTNDGLNAAINAYLASRTRTDRADALDVMGKALENSSYYRAGINAYKESLKLIDSPAVRFAYDDLRRRQGFRVVNHTIDSDSATPRACVQFSEALVKSDVDYASYVTLNGATPKALEAKGTQLCVEGLQHGERYKIALRAGLPSSVDEPLANQVDLDIYVRDRAPTVRFTGDAFVLPSTARRGIPIVSINSTSAQLKLYRVGDRNIAQLMAKSQFLTQIDGYRASQIESDFGQLVWKGEIDIQTELNKEVVTSFPVDEALPERKPGVYVLTATSGQADVTEWDTRATQWFVVSDLGLSTYAGTDGLNVFVRSLSTAKPIAGVTLTLLARNNEVLGTATSDASGRAVFAAGLIRGTASMAPAVITAQHADKDYVFLDMTRAGFDLSDRGVTGRPAPGAVDVLTWTERGIYRAGETVHVASLARDIAGQAIERLPLTYIFTRPDGVEDRRFVVNDAKLGGYALSYDLQPGAMRGSWTVRVYTDPDQAALSEKQFLVQDFVPDRIEFDLASNETAVEPGLPAKVEVDGRYLYGAPAAGLELEGDIGLKPARTAEAYPGYQFGLADEEAQEETRVTIEDLPVLDDEGKASLEINLPELPSTTQLLESRIVIRMREPGGRAVERSLTLPVKTGNEMIGIKPNFTGDVPESSNASFQVIALDGDGNKQAMTGLRWKLLKIDRHYQWYRTDGSWRYEPITTTSEAASGTVDVTPDGAGITTPVTWGRYRLEVESSAADGPVSSVEFNAGWYVEATSTETPDGLEISFDKDSYKVGETAKLRINPRFAGEALVNVGTESLITSINATVPKEGAVVDVPVTGDFGAGAYVTATLFRPGEAQESRMPMRAIGVKWLKVDPEARALDITINTPDQTLPRQPLDIELAVAGAGANEEAYVTVAAVDVGILNLTRYQPADPEAWYFGQRRLGLEIRDLYGRLIDGSLGATGRLRHGGDGADQALNGRPPTEKLVAFFAGPVKLDAEGKAKVSFDIPQFNGTARVMTVAWTRSGVGHATRDVVIRDPVVLTASLPRFLAPNDSAELRLDIANTDAPAGDYTLAIAADPVIRVEDQQASRSLNLGAGARTALVVPIRGGLPGEGNIRLTLTGPEGFEISQDVAVNVRPSTLPMTERRMVRIDPGRSLLVDSQLIANSVMEGASIAVNMTRSPAFDVPALLMTLDRYPYGCTEQTTSRALPLLYLSELSAGAGLPDDAETRKRVQEAIYRVLANQSSSGSFGLWGPGGGDFWLDAYITDFLTRAREQKFDVPEAALVAALGNLENQLNYDQNVSERGNQMAYALYVLARNRKAAISDLRYYADTMLNQFPTELAKAHIAAALALYGDRQRSERIFAEATHQQSLLKSVNWARSDYGSNLRDNAAILALAADSRPQSSIVPEMAKLVGREWEKSTYTSTQEQAWLVLAARALQNADEDIRVTVNDKAKTGNFRTRMTGEELMAKPVNIVNTGNEQVTAVITTVASPREPLNAGGDGFEISRAYYTLDGEEANISEVKQNERYVAVINVKLGHDWHSRLMIADLLPAGFEIDNPGLVNSAALSNFDWLPETQAAHLEFRYDRFLAAIDHNPGDDNEITLAYVVRAVNPGVFDHPAAYVEDMYRPQFSARTATGKMTVVKE